MDPQSTSDDPIIRTMQDPPPARVPGEPDHPLKNPPPPPGDSLSASPPAPDLLSDAMRQRNSSATPPRPPRNLGNPPSSDAPAVSAPPKPQISYTPPDAPKQSSRPTPDMTPPPSIPSFVSSPSTPPSIPTAPSSNAKPAFSEHATHGGSHATITLSILTLLLLAVGLPLIWMKANTIGSGTSGDVAALKQDVGALGTKIDGVNSAIKMIQDANAAAKQDLFNAGSDELKFADTASKVADVLITEGNRLKAEGDAAKDQPKSTQGQWMIDRGNEIKQAATSSAASGAAAQTKSGIPVNK